MFHIPYLVPELYLNYDCDIHCSNLLEDFCKVLSKVSRRNRPNPVKINKLLSCKTANRMTFDLKNILIHIACMFRSFQ